MNQPNDSGGATYANAAKDLSTSFAELMPAAPQDVDAFLSGVAQALGETEANLARRLGVSHATLSSWKSRGSIPEPHRAWFSCEFVPQIFRVDPPNTRPSPGGDIQNRGLEVALAVFKRTDFNPLLNFFSEDMRRVEHCTRLLSPMSRLGLFVFNRMLPRRGALPIESFVWEHVTLKVIELAQLGTSPPRA